MKAATMNCKSVIFHSAFRVPTSSLTLSVILLRIEMVSLFFQR
jgi:hypothetical protein